MIDVRCVASPSDLPMGRVASLSWPDATGRLWARTIVARHMDGAAEIVVSEFPMHLTMKAVDLHKCAIESPSKYLRGQPRLLDNFHVENVGATLALNAGLHLYHCLHVSAPFKLS